MPHVLRVLLDSMYANFVDMSTVCILSTEDEMSELRRQALKLKSEGMSS